MDSVAATESDTAIALDVDAPRSDGRYARASMFGLGFAALFAIAASTYSGVGMAITVAVALVGLAVAIGVRTPTGIWLASTATLVPWLLIRDNTWLSISIVCTAMLAVVLASLSAATEQRIDDVSLGAVFRRSERPPSLDVLGSSERAIFSVVRGVLVATPIVALFWMLLASADDVFAEIANPSIIPVARGALFVIILPVALLASRFAMVGRPSLPGPSRRRFGVVEASIVLGAVSALFTVFIVLRLATAGREISDAAWRGEVRSGFFQLLWVAALTVLLVLAIRQVAGTPRLSGRLKHLALLTIGLASIIDILAIQRIGEYVDRTFLSPLRFWSFGFGLWLLVVLALTALRVANVRPDKRWFTAALVTSWVVFIFVLGVVNPDQRIATHNFANPPTGENEWIAVRPLMWLSEDATPVIVDNIEALRPMPNDRYVRVVDHLCTRRVDDSWRDFHVSRRAAQDAIVDLCAGR